MLAFHRPVSWVRLRSQPDEHSQIFRSHAKFDIQRDCQNRFIETMLRKVNHDENEFNNNLSNIRDLYALEELKTPSAWVMATLTLIQQTPPESRAQVCEVRMEWLIQCGISLAAILQAKSGSLVSEQTEKEIQKALGLVREGDWEMAMALAALYDREVHRKLDTGRRPAIRGISSFMPGRKTTL
jgi:hypothetical protein